MSKPGKINLKSKVHKSNTFFALEVEGDVLLLSPDHNALRPRVPQPVDMARQLGRADAGDDVDDFEELVLSPKRMERRSSCFVDMAKVGSEVETKGFLDIYWQAFGEKYLGSWLAKTNILLLILPWVLPMGFWCHWYCYPRYFSDVGVHVCWH